MNKKKNKRNSSPDTVDKVVVLEGKSAVLPCQVRGFIFAQWKLIFVVDLGKVNWYLYLPKI